MIRPAGPAWFGRTRYTVMGLPPLKSTAYCSAGDTRFVVAAGYFAPRLKTRYVVLGWGLFKTSRSPDRSRTRGRRPLGVSAGRCLEGTKLTSACFAPES